MNLNMLATKLTLKFKFEFYVNWISSFTLNLNLVSDKLRSNLSANRSVNLNKNSNLKKKLWIKHKFEITQYEELQNSINFTDQTLVLL